MSRHPKDLPKISGVKMLAMWIIGWRATHVSEFRGDDDVGNFWILRRDRLRIAVVSDATIRRANFFWLYSRCLYVDDKKLATYRMRNGL